MDVEKLGNSVYATIGMVFYGSINGTPYSLDLLYNQVYVLTDLYLNDKITRTTFEYYAKILYRTIDFFR